MSSLAMSSKTMLDNAKEQQLSVVTLEQNFSKSHKFKEREPSVVEREAKVKEREISVRRQEINMSMREVITKKRQAEVIMLTDQVTRRQAELVLLIDLVTAHKVKIDAREARIDAREARIDARKASFDTREASFIKMENALTERKAEYNLLAQRLILSQTQINDLITEKMTNLHIREDNIRSRELELLKNYKIAEE